MPRGITPGWLACIFVSLVLRLGPLRLDIGIHAGWNFAMGNIYGIAASGLPAHSTSWIYLAPTDGALDWLSGGQFGTEASFLADVTLPRAAVVAFLVYRKWAKSRAARDRPLKS